MTAAFGKDSAPGGSRIPSAASGNALPFLPGRVTGAET
jgi:hypothetical protein